jgi:hypothetical protein
MMRCMGEGQVGAEVHVLACAECPRVSSATARGWRAYRVDDPELDEPPALAFYCPDCARREFDGEDEWSSFFCGD